MNGGFDIAGSIDGDVLVVIFKGETTPQNAQAMTKRYFEIVLGSGMKKVLVDLRALKGRLSFSDTFFHMRDLPAKPVPADIKTAIVERPENRSYAEFFETTAANAGVPFRCFLDYQEAASWLRT